MSRIIAILVILYIFNVLCRQLPCLNRYTNKANCERLGWYLFQVFLSAGATVLLNHDGHWPLFCWLAYLAMFLRCLAVIQNYSTYRDNTLSFVSRVVKNVVTVTASGCYVRPK